ncbi:MAG: terpene cyclase/mutase family protein [Planctomycetaceae bacterium]|nr:terpene cyclase/mutase family protein [Planctomycetaceae bacterium]
MRWSDLSLVVWLLVGAGGRSLHAQDTQVAWDEARAAIQRAIPLLEQGSSGSARERTCFTCHNQALPILAIVEARRRGFSVSLDNLELQLEHTAAHLTRGVENYRSGQGQGGQAMTAGYALWALEAGGRGPDDVTAAVTNYLLLYQQDQDRWTHPGKRPPSSGSDFATTYVALRGLVVFGSADQKLDIERRTNAIRDWLLSSTPRETEDSVFHLRALVLLEAGERAVQEAGDKLVATQRLDGGWAQTAERESDAYATGTALAALLQTGRLERDDVAVARAVRYLLNTQEADGSWHVVSRAEPFQTYYESGFPHGTDQFISIAASSWAVLSLLETLPGVQ